MTGSSAITSIINGVRTTYGYDGGGRAISQTTKRNNGSGTVVASYNYTWDEYGNHTQETFTEPYTEYLSTQNSATNYSYNNANRLTAAGNLTFGYDNNGNTTSRTGRTYSYDTKDNLTSASGDFSASYTYDGLGNRRSATRNGVTKQYVLNLLGSMSSVLMETDGSGNALYYYVYGANGLVSRIDANNNTHYYVYDYRGSTVAMTDATNAATVTHKYQYDEFGKVLQSEETDVNLFRYVGQLGVMYEDDALTFMRARYYDPEIGRFLSEDPIWSTNLYPYADNNPIVYLDPKGEKPKCQKYYEKTNKWLGRLQTFGKNERRLEKLNEFAKKYSMNCLSGRDSNGNLQIAPLMSVGSKNGWGGGGKNEPWMNKYSTYELEELQKGNYKNIQIK